MGLVKINAQSLAPARPARVRGGGGGTWKCAFSQAAQVRLTCPDGRDPQLGGAAALDRPFPLTSCALRPFPCGRGLMWRQLLGAGDAEGEPLGLLASIRCPWNLKKKKKVMLAAILWGLCPRLP